MTIYKAPFVCPKCGAGLQIQEIVSEVYFRSVDPNTGKLGLPEKNDSDIDRMLICEDCDEIFNYSHDDDENIISFNDDLF